MEEQGVIYVSNKVDGRVLVTENTIPYSLIKNLKSPKSEVIMPAIFNIDKKPIHYYSLEMLKHVLSQLNECIKDDSVFKFDHENLIQKYKDCNKSKKDLTADLLLKKIPIGGGKPNDLISMKHFEAFQNDLALFFPDGQLIKRFVGARDKITKKWCATNAKIDAADKYIMTEYGYITDKRPTNANTTDKIGFATIVQNLTMSIGNNCVLGDKQATTIYENVVILLKNKHHSSFIKETIQDMLQDEDEEDEDQTTDDDIKEKCMNVFSVLVGLANLDLSTINYVADDSNIKVSKYVQLISKEKRLSVIRAKLHDWNTQFADFHLDIVSDLGKKPGIKDYFWYFLIVELLLFKMLTDLKKTKTVEIKLGIVLKYKERLKVLVEKKDFNKETYLQKLQLFNKGKEQITLWPLCPSSGFPFQPNVGKKIKFLRDDQLQNKTDNDILKTLAMHYKYFLEIIPAPDKDSADDGADNADNADNYANIKFDNTSFYQPYPSIQDDKFYKKLHAKKEFKQAEKGAKGASNNMFEISPQQQWVANYLSTETPYNSLLLYWGTGVGKTCASISICEQNLAYYKQINKKIMVIATLGTMENYKKELFNEAKDRKEQEQKLPPGSLQCSGNRYYVKPQTERGQEAAHRKQIIMAKINEDYEFVAHSSIKSKLNELLHQVYLNTDMLLDNKNPLTVQQRDAAHAVISSYFSGRLIVIDEIQNIRDVAAVGKTQSKTAQLLETILAVSKNIKLVLMTATPMYDTPTEIVYLLNLMLLNDKRDIIKEKDFFKKGKFIKEKQPEFMALLRGYVSYVRGNDPATFPKYLVPQNGYVKGLETYTPRNMVEMKEQAKNFTFVKCELSKTQKIFLEPHKGKRSSVVSGVGTIFCVMAQKKKVDDSNYYKSFETLDKLQEYSPKIRLLVECIKNEDSGIIFISANYLDIPKTVSYVLSYYGMTPYHTEAPHLKKKHEHDTLLKGKYAYLGADMDVKKRQDLIDNVINSKTNLSGEKIRVIIGTSVMDEGVDLKNVRQIHILSPWFNFSRLDQIIGRGIRNNSHIALAEKDRNVTVFMYCSTDSTTEEPTPDEEFYKLSLAKDIEIKRVELMLRNAAVDCVTNKAGNEYSDDSDFTRNAAYKEKKEYSCAGGKINKSAAINTNTYQPLLHSKQTIKRYENAIKELYKKHFSFSLGRLTQLVFMAKKPTTEEKRNLFDALTLLLEPQSLHDKHGRLGRLVFVEGFYHFQPAFLDHVSNLPDYYRRTKAPEVPKKALLSANTNVNVNVNNTNAMTGKLDLVYDCFAEMYITEIITEKKKLTLKRNQRESNVDYASRIITADGTRATSDILRESDMAKISYFMDRLKKELVKILIPDVLNHKSKPPSNLAIYKVIEKYIQKKTVGSVVEWSSLAHFKKVNENNDKYEFIVPPSQEISTITTPYGVLQESKKTVSGTNQDIQLDIELKIFQYTKKGIVCSSIKIKGDHKYTKLDLYKKITGTDFSGTKINDKYIELALREKNLII